jgi:hypothetical protein
MIWHTNISKRLVPAVHDAGVAVDVERDQIEPWYSRAFSVKYAYRITRGTYFKTLEVRH